MARVTMTPLHILQKDRTIPETNVVWSGQDTQPNMEEALRAPAPLLILQGGDGPVLWQPLLKAGDGPSGGGTGKGAGEYPCSDPGTPVGAPLGAQGPLYFPRGRL
jgi:hypothetical protein